MTQNGFAVRETGGRVEMVVTGRWSAHATDTFITSAVDRLVLNYALGFEEPDLEFLVGLPVKELVILDRRMGSIAPVYSLGATLQSLAITVDPSADVELERLPNLLKLAADWSQVASSLTMQGRSYAIGELFLGKFSEPDLSTLANVRGLSQLILKDRPRIASLGGLEAHRGLKQLEVAMASMLTDISELERLEGIEHLQLEACRRIPDLENISACRGIQTLNISDCGDVASVSPLRDMSSLQVLYAHGSTKIVDADLSPIANLPRLRELRMQDRRTYRPRVAEIQHRISQREP